VNYGTVNVEIRFRKSFFFYLGAFLLTIGLEKLGLWLIKRCSEIKAS
jgi:hypothetical protein